MLSAIVLTLNEEQHLPDCLASVAWADEVIVFDSLSADRTVQIAQQAGANVIRRPFDHYAGQRNAALAATTAEWVLFVDADERVSPELQAEIAKAIKRPEPGWWLPRHNYLFGRLTLHAGWYPDYQLRLLRRAEAHYDPTRPVHELVELANPMPPGHLRAPLIHLNYETVREFMAKQKTYARYEAQRLQQQGARVRPHNFFLQPLRQFYWRLITLGGWRDGPHGLRLSLLMGWFEFEKYRQLRAMHV
jgi:hypothetical protein